jgi:hypothetical protein
MRRLRIFRNTLNASTHDARHGADRHQDEKTGIPGRADRHQGLVEEVSIDGMCGVY